MANSSIPAGPLLDRRQLLAWTSTGALGLLAACGGGDAPTGEQEVAFASLILGPGADDDTAAAVIPLTQTLLARVRGLGRASDRFEATDASFAFTAGDAWARLEPLPPALQSNFAVSLWLQSIVQQPMRLLSWTGSDGRRWTLKLNADAGAALFAEAATTPTVVLGATGRFCDGLWHRLIVQFAPGQIELLADGVRRATAPGPATPGGLASLTVGGESNLPWLGNIDDLRLFDQAIDAATALTTNFAWHRVAGSAPSANVVGHYRFSGDARNATGLGPHGIVHGAVPIADRFDRATSAYAFDGHGAHIELDEALDLGGGNLAIAFWALTESPLPMATIGLDISGGSALDIVFNAGAALSLWIDGAARLAVGEPGQYADGAWHFVVVQRVAGMFEAHVDGKPLGTAAATEPVVVTTARARFGRGSDAAPAASWQGRLDEVQLYSKALDADEIVAVASLFFHCRDGAGAMQFADRLWLLGGWNPQEHPVTCNDVWSCADGGSQWTRHSDAAWAGRHTMGCVVHAGALWILGGDNLSGSYQNEVWRSHDGEAWELVTTRLPWADRALFMSAAFNGRLWVYGGIKTFTDPLEDVAYNDVWSSADGVDWTLETAAAPWSPRGMMLGSAVFDGRLWVVGGGTYDFRRYHNDVWSSADGRQWEQVQAQAPWSPRQYHSVEAWHGLLWVMGGSTADATGGVDDVWCSPDGRQWLRLDGTPWPARHAAATVTSRRGLWLMAGCTRRLFNDVWQLRLGA